MFRSRQHAPPLDLVAHTVNIEQARSTHASDMKTRTSKFCTSLTTIVATESASQKTWYLRGGEGGGGRGKLGEEEGEEEEEGEGEGEGEGKGKGKREGKGETRGRRARGEWTWKRVPTERSGRA